MAGKKFNPRELHGSNSIERTSRPKVLPIWRPSLSLY